MKENLRLYILVPYNLSPIQQGIQALHATVELGLLGKADYVEWAKNHKTTIVLNAGTTGEGSSMEQHRANLIRLSVDFATFREPDLNNAMTGIAFIVDMSNSLLLGYLKQMGLA